MANQQVQHFLDRLQALAVERTPDAPRDRWLEQDRDDLALEIAEYLRSALDVPTLEQEISSRSRVDHEAVARVTGWFEEAAKVNPNAFARALPNGEPFKWEERLDQLRILAESLAEAQALDELEVGLRLNMVGDSSFEKLLMSLPLEHDLREKVVNALLPKLAYLSDADALDYWARLRNEVDPSLESGLKPETDVVPADFFKPGTNEDVRQRIAQYLARVRPVLVRRAFDGGQPRVPAGQAGIAQILSWTMSASTHAFSTSDRTVIRSIGRVSHYFGGDDKAKLAEALGVPVGGYLVDGRAEEEARRAFDVRGRQSPPADGLDRELVKLLRIADLRSRKRDAPLDRTLRAYKLGLEVMAQDHGEEMNGYREERLQRELCRFLVERGVIAYGTKFGWSETDVRGHDELGAALIETKILKRIPSQADVNRWLTQLGSYMNQEQGPNAIRGVLVLYNFTSATIATPIEPLLARYDLVSINLCPNPPSKRTASIEIVAATNGDDIVKVLRFGKPPTTRVRTAPKKKRAMKKQTAKKK